MGLSTHVLDTAAGRPAAGVPVRLEHHQGGGPRWRVIASGVTDTDGRIAGLPLTEPGSWRLIFDTRSCSAFFPEVTITFVVADPAEHHHVPLLLAPFGYSTYRGS
jgi:5-hydroxyisourate hydrolase